MHSHKFIRVYGGRQRVFTVIILVAQLARQGLAQLSHINQLSIRSHTVAVTARQSQAARTVHHKGCHDVVSLTTLPRHQTGWVTTPDSRQK